LGIFASKDFALKLTKWLDYRKIPPYLASSSLSEQIRRRFLCSAKEELWPNERPFLPRRS
jgi:hypothetical protein